MFFSTASAKKKKKKNAAVIKFLGILKTMPPRTKYIFAQEGKAMFRLMKKLFLSFTQFSNLIS